MKGSTYILLAAAMMFVAASLFKGQNYVAHIPEIVKDVGIQIEKCNAQSQTLTVTQRIACVRNVSFADIRKIDLRRDNRTYLRGGAKTLLARR